MTLLLQGAGCAAPLGKPGSWGPEFHVAHVHTEGIHASTVGASRGRKPSPQTDQLEELPGLEPGPWVFITWNLHSSRAGQASEPSQINR